MSTTCSLIRLISGDLDRLIDEPEYLAVLLEESQANAPPVEEVRPRGVLGLLWRFVPITVTQVRSDIPEALSGPPTASNGKVLDLDKAWHGLHFLFTQTAWEGDGPASFLVRGGEDVGSDDGLRAFRPGEVQRIRVFLDSLTRGELQRRYNPARMTVLDIYPEGIWERPATGVESPLAYLVGSFVDLQTFVRAAADAGDALLVCVV
jgi:Domain of unknown function (DUF1877)